MIKLVRVLLTLVLALLIPTPSSAETPDGVKGLWIYKARYPTGPAGRLELARTADGSWSASLAGLHARGTVRNRALILPFPSDAGTFRATIRNGILKGFWVRPPVTQDPNFPFGEALGYAAPLQLVTHGPGRWSADVRPLEDTFTLFLKIYRDPAGSLKAAFRNPELNSFGPAMLLNASVAGNVILFTADKGDPIKATIERSPERIALTWPDLKKRIELRHATPAEAHLFYPAGERPTPYTYRQPQDRGDGWAVARASAVGMDEAALARAVQRIIDRDPAADRAWLIHSMAVAYKGKLVLDEYFYGHNAAMPHDLRSASKTFSSVILGGLRLEGSQLSPASRVYDVMAPRGPFQNPDPRKSKITLGHLLTHSAGLACDDNAASSPGSEDAMEADLTKTDWTKATLDLPVQYEPGVHYAYCSMNINLAGAVLSQATGEWLPALFDRTVAEPLGFGPYYWNLQPNGEGYLGGGAFLRPRDFLKLGQAFLDGGRWKGRQVVSAEWVKDSLSPHAHISPETTGLSGEAFMENYYNVDDGWAWHMIPVTSGSKTYQAYHANGNGGQLLIIIPELDLAVMFTAGNYGQGLWNRERDEFVGGMIIPAIKGLSR